MRKTTAVLVVLLITAGSLFGISLEHEDLYDMVVPMRYDSLSVSGTTQNLLPWPFFGDAHPDDAFFIGVPFDGGDAVFQIGLGAQYSYVDQQRNYTLMLNPQGNAFLGTEQMGLSINVPTITYRLYTLELGGYPGFYFVSGDGTSLNISGDFSFDLPIQGGIGLGRMHEIFSIARAELLLNYFDVPAETETVRRTAEVLELKGARLNPMREDHAENYLSYYRELADAMGISDQADELFIIEQINASQILRFESRRYEDLKHGWEITAGVMLNPSYNLGWPADEFHIDIGPRIGAHFAGFLAENLLHYDAEGTVHIGYDTDDTNFYIGLETDFRLRYLPDNYRWWIDGEAGLDFGYYNTSFDVGFNLGAAGYYMFDPNFTVNAGTGIHISPTTQNRFSLSAGGSIRLW